MIQKYKRNYGRLNYNYHYKWFNVDKAKKAIEEDKLVEYIQKLINKEESKNVK